MYIMPNYKYATDVLNVKLSYLPSYKSAFEKVDIILICLLIICCYDYLCIIFENL
jgi:hypothetical protein